VISAGVFLMGTLFGSFLNVVILRMPVGQSIVRPASACPECGSRVRPRDNVPILSYLLLRGRCRDCGVRISPRYVVVEVLAGILPVLLYLRYGFGREFFVYWGLAYVLLVISFIDLDHRIIPDRVTLPGIAVGLVVARLMGLTTFPDSLIGAAVGGGALYLIAVLGAAVFRKESMGGGDIKLAAMLGAFVGWQAVLLLLFVAFFLGAIAGIIAMSGKGKEWDRTIPFGPFIALGAVLATIWGDAALGWYLALLG